MKAIYICLFLVVTVFSAQKEKLVLSSGFGKPEVFVIKAIMEEVSVRAGFELEFQILPNKRSLINANQGANDGEAARIWEINKSYPNLNRVPVESYSLDVVILSRKNIEIRKISDLKKYHIGVKRGMKIGEVIINKSGAKNVVRSTNHQTLMQMLSDGRLDVIVANKVGLFTNLKGLKKSTFFMNKKPIVSRPLYIQLHTHALSKKLALENALKSMHKDGTYDKIRNSFAKSIEDDSLSSIEVIMYE